MSKRTLELHWGEHHGGYVENLNKQLEKNDILYGHTTDELIKVTYNYGNPLPEFNNAAEVCSELAVNLFKHWEMFHAADLLFSGIFYGAFFIELILYFLKCPV